MILLQYTDELDYIAICNYEESWLLVKNAVLKQARNDLTWENDPTACNLRMNLISATTDRAGCL